MSVWRAALASRSIREFLALLAVVLWPGHLIGQSGFLIDIRSGGPRVVLSFLVLAAIGVAAAGSMLLRSRMWDWERLGSWRSGLVAAVAATVTIAGATAMACMGKPVVEGHHLGGMNAADGLFFSALLVLLVPFVGVIIAAAISAGFFSVSGLCVELWPYLNRYLPAGGAEFHAARWPQAVLVAVIAFCVHFWTRGSTERLQRWANAEE
jgi:hypothetical protein